MLRRIFFTLLMLLAIVNSSRSASAHDSRVDLEVDVLEIESDDSHDIVVVRENPEDETEIEVLILQFDDPVSLFDFATEEEIIDAADDFRDEYYDFDEVQTIVVRTFDGDDSILIGSNIDLPCTLIAGLGDDYVNSGGGDDVIWGDEEFVTDGSQGGADSLDGNGGEDVIHGGPENDTMWGGNENDEMHGGSGNDIMFGGSGNDDMFGGQDDDTMRGGSDNDEMHGEEGEDSMDGDSGDDDMFGGPDNDEMFGGTDHDVMFGEGGDDEMFGEAGQDDLFGGDDNDYLDGAYDGEVDVLEGGAGVDEFVNRYYEVRTYTYYQLQVISVPVMAWRGRLPVIEFQRQYVYVPVTGSYHYNFELEFINDYSVADGDILSPVEVN